MITPGQYRNAAAQVRRRGKATGSFQDADGRVCTAGALQFAFHDTLDEGLALRQVARMLGWAGDDSSLGSLTAVATWNDQPHITAEDVALLLEQAAEKLEAEQGVI
jgi:hypothetical protein